MKKNSKIYIAGHKGMVGSAIYRKLQAEGFSVANIDITVVAQKPKLAPHVTAMCTHIALDLDISLKAVNVKATTTENLGYVGRGEGIACHAVCLLHLS